ncbi:MAG: beta-N-acetylhexosaminidase [Betaproteobacteria bacterium]|nr:beta-N-acetylhexosaminidase [Betaproteobacteria bacterium]MDE2623452.1 beta-N-acetylhexosaminidase [Betaproteobacteria bacterium]
MSGPVMIDIAGFSPTAEEMDLIRNPLVGGVILFTRNYDAPAQLQSLTAALHALRPGLLIAVDHEGGRVQRFRSGFTELPSMGSIGQRHAQDPALALRLAEAAGFVLAWELRALGVDLSFAPVLDLDYGRSAVIGNRAFHRDPEIVSQLAVALRRGLHAAGFAAVGKHFPGHGFVEADSHHDLPVDSRPYAAIESDDLKPFQTLVQDGLEGIMPAHILYDAVDNRPAGFSPFWLQQVLRGRLGFDGVIFSDDLSMKGAVGAGTPAERARAALDAGCDMVLLCNDPVAARELLDGLAGYPWPAESARRLAMLAPAQRLTPAAGVARYHAALAELEGHA